MDENSQQRYEAWNKRKQMLATGESYQQLFFREKDIWWCSLGLNVGSESYGKGGKFRRPVLILKKLTNDFCICLPLTSQPSHGSWFVEIILNKAARWVMLCQIKALHKKRFESKLGYLSAFDFCRVKEKLESLLELSHKSSPGHLALDRE